VTPPPPRGTRRRDRDLDDILRLTKRRRERGRGNRKQRVKIFFGALIALVLVLLVTGVGAVAQFQSSCDLSQLRQVQIGENSFVYAFDGSTLGSIPAERNRTPVTLRKVSLWERKATVAIEDHRFYEHGGVDYYGIARAAWQDLQAGHVEARQAAQPALAGPGADPVQ